MIPSFAMMTICIAGIGALPYYLRRLMYGEYPRAKDDFEKFVVFQKSWDAGAAFSSTHAYQADTQREKTEQTWQKKWTELLK